GEGNIGIIIDNKTGIKHPCDFSQSERFEKDLSACFVLFPVLYQCDTRLQDYLDGLTERVNPWCARYKQDAIGSEVKTTSFLASHCARFSPPPQTAPSPPSCQ